MPATSARVSWRPSMRQRLAAWWDGYDLLPPRAKAANDERARLAMPERKKPTRDPKRLADWDEGRIAINERLWGEDFLHPGGRDYHIEFATPLELSASSNILDLAAGIGGGPRTLHDAFKAWVDGYERHPLLAEEGARRSAGEELQTTASVKQHDCFGGALPQGDFDCVIARDLFYQMRDKRKLLSNIHRILRAPGQLSFTDYIVGDPSKKDQLAEWKAGEPGEVFPIMLNDWQDLLQGIGFSLRVAEDVSERYAELILQGWRNVYMAFASGRLPPQAVLWLHDEADFWATRSKAIESGALRVVRLQVAKKAPLRD